MIIPVKPEKVRLAYQYGANNISASSITHDFDVKKLYDEQTKNNYELAFICNNGVQYISDEYKIYIYQNHYYIMFVIHSDLGALFLVRFVDNGSGNITAVSYGLNEEQVLTIAHNCFESDIIDRGLANSSFMGLGSETFDSLDIQIYDSESLFVIQVYSYDETSGTLENLFLKYVPSGTLTASSTPSTFALAVDGEDSSIYHITPKTTDHVVDIALLPVFGSSADGNYAVSMASGY